MQIASARGKGPPVLLLHGSPSTPDAFDSLAEALALDRRVLVGALPGYGHVPALLPYDLDRLHAGIETAIARETDGPIDLVGFSTGSYHALAVALRGQVRVRSVVALGGLPGVPDEARADTARMSEAVRAGAVPPDAFTARMLSEAFRVAHPAAAEVVTSWTTATTMEVLADELAAIAAAPNLLPALERSNLRLLARVGELDVATPPALSQALARASRSALLEIVPGAGHALIVEDARATQESVQRFLNTGF